MSDATKILTTMMMLGMMIGGGFSSEPVDFDLQDKSEEMLEADADKSEEVSE